MAVRVPAILDEVLTHNLHYPDEFRDSSRSLGEQLRGNLPLPPPNPRTPYAESWVSALAKRRGQSWLETDWFFAETYAYRQLVERIGYWDTGRDPFGQTKKDDYASTGHSQALAGALQISGSIAERLDQLLALSLLGNRMDLSFAASRDRGTSAEDEDLLIDDRKRVLPHLLEGTGAIHFLVDNAGPELTLDLVLADLLLEELKAPVVLHVKAHPTFVSDATAPDVYWFLGIENLATPRLHRAELGFQPSQSPATGPGSEPLWETWGAPALAFRERLRGAISRGQLEVRPHPFWNGPEALWEMPKNLAQSFEGARLVLLKGDANYRRAVNDALWAPETPFSEVMSYFPTPILALRMLKSDPVVGLPPGRAQVLDHLDPTWRVNGKRGVLSLAARS